MLQTINVIGDDTKSPEARQMLLRHVTLIQVESETGSLVEVTGSQYAGVVKPCTRN